MSINAMNQVFELDIPVKQKLVMLVLADYCDAEGWCFPGREKIVRRTSLSDSTIYRILKQLEDDGYIEQVRRHDEGGHRTSNGYRLLPGRLSVKLTGRPTRQNGVAYPSTVTVTKEPSVLEPPVLKKRGTRIDENFTVDESMKTWAKEAAPDVDLISATMEFVDYWISIPGQKGIKLDWVATWRNWIRRSQTFSARRSNVTPLVRPKPLAPAAPRGRNLNNLYDDDFTPAFPEPLH